MEENVFYATGKRKTAIARVRMLTGEGKFEINKRTLDEYFERDPSTESNPDLVNRSVLQE